MKNAPSALSLVLLLSLLYPTHLSPGTPADPKWQPLFNGKDLTGWVQMNDVTFQARDGNLRLVSGMGWLRTEKQYSDFILEFEWRALTPEYDSGFFFRAPLDGKPWPPDAWQLNLLYSRLAALVKGTRTVVPSETPKMPLNKWTKFRFEARGTKAVLDVDGERAWETDLLEPSKGFIGIQAENKSFDFREIRILELTPASRFMRAAQKERAALLRRPFVGCAAAQPYRL